jgi:hypothetical protein
VKSAADRAECLKGRIEGKSYQALASQLGISKARAYQHVKAGLARLRAKCDEQAEELMKLELMRLDQLQAACWPTALTGDPKAVTAALRVMDMRAKLQGLYPRPGPEAGGYGALDALSEAELVREAQFHGVPVPDHLALKYTRTEVTASAPAVTGLPFSDRTGFPPL